MEIPDLERRVGIERTDALGYERGEVQRAVVSALLHIGLEPHTPGDERGPLASLICPGSTVLLKPNMVRQADSFSSDWDCLITHGEVVRAAAMLAAQALVGRGRLLVADGPHIESDFSAVASAMRLEALQHEVSQTFGIEIEVLDLREEYREERQAAAVEAGGVSTDPDAYVEFDLGEGSEFHGYPPLAQLRSNDLNTAATRRSHAEGCHRYRLARIALEADLVINLPKMKTHQKTGVSLGLKNLVGIHGDRNYLPHYTAGHQDSGGDESPWSETTFRARRHLIGSAKTLANWVGLGHAGIRRLKRAGPGLLASQAIKDGNWYGNDTAWRMVLDLNKLFYYGRADGSLAMTKTRRCLTIVDGVVAGEGDGPINVDGKDAGLVVAGLNPVAVDTVCSVLMGFDPRLMKMLARAWDGTHLPLVDFEPSAVRCSSNVPDWTGGLAGLLEAPHCGFAPPSGWRFRLERQSAGRRPAETRGAYAP